MAKLGYFAFLASLALVWRRDAAFACAKSREMVAGWTLNRRAASAAVFLPFETILNYFDLLLWSEFRTAAADSALPASIVEAGLGSFAKHSAFKLSKRTEHLHHHTPGRACGIDRFAQAPESSLCLGNVFQNGEDIAKGAREPVELPHYKDIRLSKLVKKSMQFGPIPTAAGSFLAKDPLASCGFEGANLCGGILFVCGDSCVTDKHVAQRYCE